MKDDSTIRIALVGNPNCGKSALFNALTGSKQRVANYAGVTVEKKHGYFIMPNHVVCTLIDLPGTYSLSGRSPDEKITRDVVMNQYADEMPIDLILCVLDATNLQNGLRLVLELQQTGKPILVALNMSDLAKNRGYHYKIDRLKAELGCEVIETTAIKKRGVRGLLDALDKIIPSVKLPSSSSAHNNLPEDKSNSREYHIRSAAILAQVKLGEGIPSQWNDKIDRVLLHPLWGVLILTLVLFLVFQAVFSWATIPQDILQSALDSLQGFVIKALPNSLLGSLLGNGIIAGVGAVLVFLPQILTISLFIVLLEDSGYMSRAAFLMDKIMGSVGLNSRAFIPLLSSFACAIPGILATRTIENRNDRLVTILISPLMVCSARLPIYTLLISALIPAKTVFGFLSLQGLIMFLLYFSGMFFGLLVALVMKLFFFKKEHQPSIIELPSYKMPIMRNVIIELIKPAKMFLKRAGTIIVAIMIILWFLSSFPLPPSGATLPAINYSFVGILGKLLHPLFIPIGFPWQVVAALIPGIAAREVVVSALGTIYSLSGNDDVLAKGLGVVLSQSWSLATGLSLLTWYIFAPQCASTLAVVKRETNSWKWPIIVFSYQMVLAYAAAFIVYNVTQLIMN
ncbi:MAG: ferrous iron transporter B [Burkholderiales bacterium]|nr:ferrous iron transporter B [Burkholderiales bacterium]